MVRHRKNIKIFLNYFLGPVLFAWLSFSIYRQVKNQPDLKPAFFDIQEAIYSGQSWVFLAIVVMMGFNWGIEALKWRLLLRPLERISLARAFKAILAGLAFALNTPNRMGEYGGRILYVQEGHRVQAVSLSIAGSFSQLIVTLFCGCCGLIFLLNIDPAATVVPLNASYIFWVKIVLCIVSGILAGCLVLYFRLGWLFRLLEKQPFLAKRLKYIAVLQGLESGVLGKVLALSLLRYLVFITQYVLMLQLMQVDMSGWQAFWLISVLFLILAVIPTIALADIGIRGQASLELFGLFSANKLGIITASAGIWAVNLLLPALIGSILIVGIKIFDSK